MCDVLGCENEVYANGYCFIHSRSEIRYKTGVYNTPPVKKGPCKVKDCGTVADTGGYCVKHYTRWLRHGVSGVESPDREKYDGCSIEGCTNKHHAKKFCQKHYGDYRRDNKLIHLNQIKQCGVKGCTNPHSAKGLCSKHYAAQYKRGIDVGVPSPAKIKYPETCTVDECDAKSKIKGMCSKHYHASYRDKLKKSRATP